MMHHGVVHIQFYLNKKNQRKENDMSEKEQQKFIQIIEKIIKHDDSNQFFYYKLVCNSAIDKIITHDEWKFIKEQLTKMGYFDIAKPCDVGVMMPQ